MSNVNLNGYKVTELSFVNKAENGEKLQLQNKFSYNVRYSNNASSCVGEMMVEVAEKDKPELFGIKLVISGVFTIKDNSVPREVIHVQTFKELFPFAKTIVANTTTNAGVPPIFIQNIDIENQSIYRIDKNPPENFGE